MEYLEEFSLNRRSRLEALTTKKSRNTKIPPEGLLITSITVKQLRYKQEILEEEEAKR